MKVDIGELTEVVNKQARFGAKSKYKFVILVENGVEKKFMFTDRELDIAARRSDSNKEDWHEKRTFWQRVFKKR